MTLTFRTQKGITRTDPSPVLGWQEHGADEMWLLCDVPRAGGVEASQGRVWWSGCFSIWQLICLSFWRKCKKD